VPRSEAKKILGGYLGPGALVNRLEREPIMHQPTRKVPPALRTCTARVPVARSQ